VRWLGIVRGVYKFVGTFVDWSRRGIAMKPRIPSLVQGARNGLPVFHLLVPWEVMLYIGRLFGGLIDSCCPQGGCALLRGSKKKWPAFYRKIMATKQPYLDSWVFCVVVNAWRSSVPWLLFFTPVNIIWSLLIVHSCLILLFGLIDGEKVRRRLRSGRRTRKDPWLGPERVRISTRF
jgi:hypothetical protein